MKPGILIAVAAGAAWMILIAQAQAGPFPDNDWPPTRDPAKAVHFIDTHGALSAPGAAWLPGMTILTGGDHATEDIVIGGYTAKKVTGNFLNIADSLYEEWSDDEFIDILVQAYGDDALFNAQGEPRDFEFLTGTLPELDDPVGGQVPVEAKNRKWNWILFRIPNGIRASDGTRLVGSIPANATGAFAMGGVNGGTIRFQGVPNLIVRVIAFGQEGAFGTPEDFTQFALPDACDPEPPTNLVGIDVSGNTTNHVQILNDGDQTVAYEDNVGPTADRRRVVRPTGMFLNFGITDNYLGKPCNDPRAVKVCVEFYDDPAYAGGGVRFGPEKYATDDQTGEGTVAEDRRHVMEGSGLWVRRSWTVSAVNLRGINTGTLTGGPRFISEGAAVAVSNFQLAVLRTGEHPLAGQDPLAMCYEDPQICTDAYGNFAELDLGQDVRNGLDVGGSGGDQEMIVAEAGPANDRRQAVRPAFDDGTPGFAHQYLNFSITEEALGPNSQPPARLAICATYYDDPALIGSTLRPEVYQTERNGSLGLAFTPESIAVALEGSDTWKEAYWEIADMKFNGVNQGPQAAARFMASAGGKIFVTRLRYAVIRPCGPNAGMNLLEACKPLTLGVARAADGKVRLSWPSSATDFALQSADALDTTASWQPVTDAPVVEGDRLVVLVTPVGTKFYRLAMP